MKCNENQVVWLLQKVRRSTRSNHGFNTFQEFLDNQQYSNTGILRYEKIFGRTFVSTGGLDTTKVRFFSIIFYMLLIIICGFRRKYCALIGQIYFFIHRCYLSYRIIVPCHCFYLCKRLAFYKNFVKRQYTSELFFLTIWPFPPIYEELRWKILLFGAQFFEKKSYL